MAELRRYTKEAASRQQTSEYRVEDDGRVNLPAEFVKFYGAAHDRTTYELTTDGWPRVRIARLEQWLIADGWQRVDDADGQTGSATGQ